MLQLCKIFLYFLRLIFTFFRNYFGLYLNILYCTIVLRKTQVYLITSWGASSSNGIPPVGFVKSKTPSQLDFCVFILISKDCSRFLNVVWIRKRPIQENFLNSMSFKNKGKFFTKSLEVRRRGTWTAKVLHNLTINGKIPQFK